ncbi:MAG TPA: hypothetical protein VMQ76_10855 [Terracidiphilus sp.]|nr:hypothetical protein [Terracidiphilus sp.]
MKTLLILLLSALSLFAQQQMLLNRPAVSSAPIGPTVTAITLWTNYSSSATTVVTLTNSVPAGDLIVVTFWSGATNLNISSVTDTANNSYTVTFTTNLITLVTTEGIAQAYAATGLSVGSTITLTLTNALSSKYQIGMIFAESAVSILDTNKFNDVYGNSAVSLPAAVVAKTCQAGWIQTLGAVTYSSGNWTTLLGPFAYQGSQFYFLGNVTAGAGTANPGGSISSSSSRWFATWQSDK